MKTFNQLMAQRKQKGFTLVEIGIVIAIGAVILAIALSVVPRLIASNKARAELGNLPQIAGKMQQVFSNEPVFTDGLGVNNAVLLAQLGVFGDEMVVRNGANIGGIKNRWGGDVTTETGNIATLGDSANIIYAQVPSQECKELAAGLGRAFRVITVANNTVKTDGNRPNVSAIASNCGENVKVTMKFTLGK